MSQPKPDKKKGGPLRPFRRAVVRGIGVILPPLLTIVIFVWVGSTVNTYVMQPVKNVTRKILVWTIDDQVKTFPGVPPNVYLATKDETKYRKRRRITTRRAHRNLPPVSPKSLGTRVTRQNGVIFGSRSLRRHTKGSLLGPWTTQATRFTNLQPISPSSFSTNESIFARPFNDIFRLSQCWFKTF